MGRLEGKNVFITGASAGIGEATAREFAKEGSNLVLAARRAERLEELKKDLLEKYPSIKIHVAALDISKKAEIDRMMAALPEEFKEIDVLVNNAGMVIGVDHLVDVEEEVFDIMIATNIKGLVFLTQAILRGMKARQSGHIINLGSVAGKQGYAGGSIYCATKHAVDAITKALLFELVDTPIRVSQICPGLVNTEFSTVRFRGDKEKADNVYKGIDPLQAQDIAELITFTASRPARVNIADMLVFPICQADSKTVSRKL
ncbi:uncharacterized protein BYT42DRAFT_558642 [Radiomyces spectabilis]|uniref:uncharacterized protein n=1 Tax=Radiomyces spectabilis TaxID=64574 RepID=UPI00221F8A1C|nr:uncharacterized protein BYT42DRAFT_558642 [Radiomyces spectabilis]KAI8388016.1 hypothetical protein BYT42DRAFT_558642 [Radiomyces spectabilis]